MNSVPIQVSIRINSSTGSNLDFPTFPTCRDDETAYSHAKETVLTCLKGYNATIFNYGPERSGKSDTMGRMMEFAVCDLFRYVVGHRREQEFVVRVACYEICNETFVDLIASDLNEVRDEGNMRDELVMNSAQCVRILKECREKQELNKKKRLLNSHFIFRLSISSLSVSDNNIVNNTFSNNNNNNIVSIMKVSQLYFVDIASMDKSNSNNSKNNNNKSIITLNNIVQKLSEQTTSSSNSSLLSSSTASSTSSSSMMNLPFGDSKLTKVLQLAFGGNCRAFLIAHQNSQGEENRSTLLFANRVKKIVNKVKVNRIDDEKIILRRLRQDLQDMRKKFVIQAWQRAFTKISSSSSSLPSKSIKSSTSMEIELAKANDEIRKMTEENEKVHKSLLNFNNMLKMRYHAELLQLSSNQDHHDDDDDDHDFSVSSLAVSESCISSSPSNHHIQQNQQQQRRGRSSVSSLASHLNLSNFNRMSSSSVISSVSSNLMTNNIQIPALPLSLIQIETTITQIVEVVEKNCGKEVEIAKQTKFEHEEFANAKLTLVNEEYQKIHEAMNQSIGHMLTIVNERNNRTGLSSFVPAAITLNSSVNNSNNSISNSNNVSVVDADGLISSFNQVMSALLFEIEKMMVEVKEINEKKGDMNIKMNEIEMELRSSQDLVKDSSLLLIASNKQGEQSRNDFQKILSLLASSTKVLEKLIPNATGDLNNNNNNNNNNSNFSPISTVHSPHVNAVMNEFQSVLNEFVRCVEENNNYNKENSNLIAKLQKSNNKLKSEKEELKQQLKESIKKLDNITDQLASRK